MATTDKNNSTNIIGIVLIAVIISVIVFSLMQPKEKEPETRLGRAVEKLGEGINDAGDELKPDTDKTTGEKIGDAVKDVGQDIKDSGKE